MSKLLFLRQFAGWILAWNPGGGNLGPPPSVNQTRPPDPLFGVSWVKQAKYLKQAYAIARRNPRITMMLWFLLKDEPRIGGWQSGLETAAGKKKPSYRAFRIAARARGSARGRAAAR